VREGGEEGRKRKSKIIKIKKFLGKTNQLVPFDMTQTT
jgi:predicted membrane protein